MVGYFAGAVSYTHLILRPTLFNSLLAVSVSWWTWYTRLVYGMSTSLRNEMYVKSAELIGASRAHILFREILPNCFGAVFTKMTLDMGWKMCIRDRRYAGRIE